MRLAGEQAFADYGWQLGPHAPDSDSLVTTWKPMHKLVVRLLFGEVKVRCTVTIDSLAPERTTLVFRGAINTEHDMASSPMRPAACKAYASGAEQWVDAVKRRLRSSATAAAAAAGTSAAVGAAGYGVPGVDTK